MVTELSISVIIPAFNEQATIGDLLKKVISVNIHKEIIVVDDGSTDQTAQIVRKFPVKLIQHKVNRGKGAAIRTGLMEAKMDVVVIQDADLEYDPEDYHIMMVPFRYGFDAVYGSRRLNVYNNPFSSWLFYMGGNALTYLTNVLFGLKLTDSSTCYKIVRRDIIQNLGLTCERFEFCPELTSKLAKKGVRIFEVPIRYYPRSHDEGKKIGWKDGVEAAKTLLKEKFSQIKKEIVSKK